MTDLVIPETSGRLLLTFVWHGDDHFVDTQLIVGWRIAERPGMKGLPFGEPICAGDVPAFAEASECEWAIGLPDGKVWTDDREIEPRERWEGRMSAQFRRRQGKDASAAIERTVIRLETEAGKLLEDKDTRQAGEALLSDAAALQGLVP